MFERRLVSDKFRWRLAGSCVLAVGVLAGWGHVRLIAAAYRQAVPYSPSSMLSGIFKVGDAPFAIANDIGRMFAHLGLGQRNWAVGLGILAMMWWAGLYCYRHRSRKLAFPMTFIVVGAVLMISTMGSWTMASRYWFYALPFVIYYLFKSFELLGGLATKAIKLRKPLLPLPKFAAIGIYILLLIQLPLIVRDNFIAMSGWGQSPEEFYKEFDRGRNAEIMSLADELAREESEAWIAASGKHSVLLAFSGRYVHGLQIRPLDVIRSDPWRLHPPAVVLVKRPKPGDAIEAEVHQQLMDLFHRDREHWALDRETKRWLVFKRKTGQAKPDR